MSVKNALRSVLVLTFGLAAWHCGTCQEKAVLDASAARAKAAKPVVVVRGSAGFGGVIDGLQPAPQVTLTIRQIHSIESPGSRSPALGHIFYEMRLRNTGAKPISLPTSPDRDQVIAQCGTSPMVESGIAIKAKQSASAESPTPGQWQDYYGCPQVASTMILLIPGEWITYRGTTTIPIKVPQTAPLEGSWVLSDVRYTSVANGLREDSDLMLSVHSEAKTFR